MNPFLSKTFIGDLLPTLITLMYWFKNKYLATYLLKLSCDEVICMMQNWTVKFCPTVRSWIEKIALFWSRRPNDLTALIADVYVFSVSTIIFWPDSAKISAIQLGFKHVCAVRNVYYFVYFYEYKKTLWELNLFRVALNEYFR